MEDVDTMTPAGAVSDSDAGGDAPVMDKVSVRMSNAIAGTGNHPLFVAAPVGFPQVQGYVLDSGIVVILVGHASLVSRYA